MPARARASAAPPLALPHTLTRSLPLPPLPRLGAPRARAEKADLATVNDLYASAYAQRIGAAEELYYAELQRCYEVLCERGIPVPS